MNLITKDVIGIFSTRGLANQYLLNTFTKKKRNVGYKSEPKFIYDSKQPYIIRKSYIGEVIEVEIWKRVYTQQKFMSLKVTG